MGRMRKVVTMVKEFSATYPAVLSGYIMYSYLFISIIRFYLKAKSREMSLYDIYESFDALPFMWLLSSALVSIIDMRTKLHETERARILEHRELEIKQTQLRTMNEVAKGFQHRINNPLAIIYLAVNGLRRSAGKKKEVVRGITLVADSTADIAQAVTDFSKAHKYEVENIEALVGAIASPGSAKPTGEGL
jgi:signal transduction histidine kinase